MMTQLGLSESGESQTTGVSNYDEGPDTVADDDHGTMFPGVHITLGIRDEDEVIHDAQYGHGLSCCMR